MRYGYWLPVFGGWLRNVDDEGMAASWDYVRRLAQRSAELRRVRDDVRGGDRVQRLGVRMH